MKHNLITLKHFVFAIFASVLLMSIFYFLESKFEKKSETAGETTFSSQGSQHQKHNRHHRQFSRKCKNHQKNKNCFTEEFQVPGGESGPVDLLFVLQTSNSLLAEKPTILAQINEFISTLPEEADVNIAVILSHGSTSDLSGRLYGSEGQPLVLSGSILTNAQIQTALTLRLISTPQDPDSGGGEEGLYSVFHAITTSTLLDEAQAAGFFRPNASLGIVFIADQRDICAPASAGVPAETDPVKIEARIRDCEGLTPQGLTSRLETLKGDEPVAVSGIIYVDPPTGVDNEIGYGYLEMISLNPGVALDINNDDIAAGLAAQLAELGGVQPGSQNSFLLSHSGANSATVSVQVNGQDVPFQLSGDTVTVTEPIPAGATVIISYCLRGNLSTSCKYRFGPKHHGHLCRKGDFFENHNGKGHGKHHPH